MKNKKIVLSFAIASFLTTVLNAQIYVDGSGAVSIGTTVAPPVTLQIMGDAMFPSVTGTTNSCAFITANNGYSTATTPDYNWWYDSQTGIYHPSGGTISFTTGGTKIMNLSQGNGGQIDIYNQNTYGVGLISHIISSATTFMVNNGSTNTFYVYGGGQVWGNSYNTLSDVRLKENVSTIGDALNKVLRLHGVTYTYIADKMQDDSITTSISRPVQIQMGLIAQEVEQVVPEVVRISKDGYKGVQYQNLIGLLIEAIKQEDKKVTNLQNRLDSCCNLTPQYGLQEQNPTVPNNTSTIQSASTQALLYQNIPNPFSKNTSIQCYVPITIANASILIFDMTGALKNTIPVSGRETQVIQISGNTLSAGMYYYSLIVDGTEVATKKMILTNQ